MLLRRRSFPRLVLSGVCLLLAGRAWSGPVFTEDFQNTNAEAWSSGKGQKTQIVRQGDSAFLRLVGRQQKTLKLPCRGLRDFVLRARVRGPGGVHFRAGYKVFFKPDGTMWIRRPGAMLLRWVRERRDLSQFHEIRVVCAGKIVRIYVDDVMELECLDHSPVAESFHLCGSGDFAEIRVSEDIPVNDAVVALPVDAGANFIEEGTYARLRPAERKARPRVPDTALVFRTDESVRIPIQIMNESETRISVRLRAGIDRFTRETVGDQIDQQTAIDSGARKVHHLEFGRFAKGFHRLGLSLFADGEAIRTTTYPVFVGVAADRDNLKPPSFPVGVLLREIVWKPIHTKTYWHATAACLREHRLNTVVATGGCHREFPEIFERYGIATMVRSSNRIEYRSVLGLLNSSRDPTRMAKLQETYAKPVLTYLAVESVGKGGAADPLEIWRKTPHRIRMLRIHPFRRDRNDWLACGHGLDLPEVLHRVHSGFDTPWWALLQASGDISKSGPYRNPTPAELCAQTHLVLAFGAKGILYYSFQGSMDTVGLVDSISLRPADDKMTTIGKLATHITEHAQTLGDLSPGRWKWKAVARAVTPDADANEPNARVGDADIVVASLKCAAGPAAYAINTNTKRPVRCRISLPEGFRARKVRDVYEGRLMEVEKNAVHLNLGRGEGKLLVVDE